MRRFLMALLAVALTVAAAYAADSGLALLQPDAGFALGIEWRKIVDSSLGAELSDQLKKQKLPGVPMEKLQETLLHDLDSIVIAARASAIGKSSAQPPALAVVKGRFVLSELRSLAKGNAMTSESYRSVELLGGPQGKAKDDNTRIAFLDANTLLAGDRREVMAAIDRAKTGRLASTGAGILAGAAQLSAANDIWLTFNMPTEVPKDAPPAAAQMMASLRGGELGMSFQQGLGLRLNLRAKDAASAASLQQMLQGLIAMGAMQQPQSPETAELIKKIQISAESSRVKLALNLDRAEMQKLMEKAKSNATTRNAGMTPTVSGGASSTIASPQTEPSGPKTIRITGLDKGPVEIPLNSTKK